MESTIRWDYHHLFWFPSYHRYSLCSLHPSLHQFDYFTDTLADRIFPGNYLSNMQANFLHLGAFFPTISLCTHLVFSVIFNCLMPIPLFDLIMRTLSNTGHSMDSTSHTLPSQKVYLSYFFYSRGENVINN